MLDMIWMLLLAGIAIGIVVAVVVAIYQGVKYFDGGNRVSNNVHRVVDSNGTTSNIEGRDSNSVGAVSRGGSMKWTSGLGFKIVIIFVLGFLMLIPTTFISEIVRDRVGYQRDAVESVVEPIGGELYLSGVLLVIPYTTREYNSEKNVTTYANHYTYISPESYMVEGDVETSILNRGIFKIPTFSSDMKLNGNFEKFVSSKEGDVGFVSYDMSKAFLIVGTGSKKGFRKVPIIKIGNTVLKENEAPLTKDITVFSNSFIYKLPQRYLENGFKFDTSIAIQGANAINIRPLNSQNTFSLSSKWSDPSFLGGWIPSSRDVTDEGFKVTWEIPGFNTSFPKVWDTEGRSYNQFSQSDYITTDFLLLSDNYKKTVKSIKYALLFIFIPFFALFLSELRNKKPLHFIQYCLVGFANVIFFLLLLSISEHLSFNLSYFISAIMVTSIVSVYAGFITNARKVGIGIAIVQLLSYIFLFGILQLTDYALVVGSFGLFMIIAAAMYITRNVNWFNTISKEDN